MYAATQKDKRMLKVTIIFFFFMLAIPDMTIYKEEKPEMQCVIAETTLSNERTG